MLRVALGVSLFLKGIFFLANIPALQQLVQGSLVARRSDSLTHNGIHPAIFELPFAFLVLAMLIFFLGEGGGLISLDNFFSRHGS